MRVFKKKTFLKKCENKGVLELAITKRAAK